MKRIVYGFIGILYFSTILFAGTTGKIAGHIRDAITKEPLVGANVIIEGTLLGASTDSDGDFYIINIPVGTYTTVVSYVGYGTIKHPGVRVILDQTTKVNFELTEDIAEGETIIVTAETFKVQKDETTKKITLHAEDIQSLPVQDFSELIAAQAGVIQIESSVQGISGFEDRGIEEIHVRGGRYGEIGYTIDGMYITNPFYGSKYSGTELNDFAVEQVDMKTGVFDAEYGGALSSMVNIITRDGGNKIEGNIRIMTSNFGNLHKLFDDDIDTKNSKDLTLLEQDYQRDYREISGGIGGPVFTQRVKFILTGHKMSSSYRVYEFDNLTQDNAPDITNSLDTLSGWNAMGFRHSWDVYGKLSFRIGSTMRLDVSAWWIENIFRSANLSNSRWMYHEAGRIIDTQTSDRQAIMFNHQLSRKTFYDIRVSRFWQKMFIGVTDDGTKDGEYLDATEYKWYRSGEYDPVENPYGGEFWISGHDRYVHLSYAQTYEAFFNLISQASKHHQLKLGASYRRHDIMIDEEQIPQLRPDSYFEEWKKQPEEASAYLQDLIEYDYMTIHVGLRLDIFNAHNPVWRDVYNIDEGFEESKWEYSLCPRLGFSHVITDNATFTFGYGKFTQTPTYRNKYINFPSEHEIDLTTPMPIIGNSGLSVESVTAYEFGLNVGIGRYVITQLIGWSKEYSNLTSTERIPDFPYSYSTFRNSDYATARGFDIVGRLRAPSIAVVLQYTYSKATSNRPDPWEGYREGQTIKTQPKREILMHYDRTHDLSIMGVFRTNKWVPEYPTVLNFIFLAMSGAPYTPVSGGVTLQTYSERGPWNYTLNFNLRQYFKIYGQQLIFGIMVQNLFDWKNPIDIWPETGKADDPGPRWNGYLEDKLISTTYLDHPYRYSRRRQINFSLEYAF